MQARAVRGIIQQFVTHRLHGSMLGLCWFQQARFLYSSLEVWNGLGVSARCAAGLSAAHRAAFAVTAIRLQSLTHLRACGTARFACLQGIGARPIPAARSLAPL